MKILVVHPEMKFLGGDDMLCDTIPRLTIMGHEITVLSEAFDPQKTEVFFAPRALSIGSSVYLFSEPSRSPFGTPSHLIHHIEVKMRVLSQLNLRRTDETHFLHSRVDYVPDISVPVLQWGISLGIFLNSSRFFCPTCRYVRITREDFENRTRVSNHHGIQS